MAKRFVVKNPDGGWDVKAPVPAARAPTWRHRRRPTSGRERSSRTLAEAKSSSRTRPVSSAIPTRSPRRTTPTRPGTGSTRRDAMATRAPTLVVATLEANADGVLVATEVRKEGGRYVVVLEGRPVDSATNLRSAFEALAHAVRRRLPHGNPATWGVAWRCNTGGFGLVYGNRSGGGGGGELNPCLQAAVARYRENTLHHALEHAIATLARCCS
jgi:hypothetical protein